MKQERPNFKRKQDNQNNNQGRSFINVEEPWKSVILVTEDMYNALTKTAGILDEVVEGHVVGEIKVQVG